MEPGAVDQEACPGPCSGPQSVPGAVSSGRKLSAEASDCESHLQPHHDVAVQQKDQQGAPSTDRRVEEGLTDVSLAPSPTAEPATREDFLQYATQITLDPSTAHKQLVLSEGNRRATVVEEEQSPPDSGDRFINYGQVLSREILTGRCYWELEWDGDWLYVAVSYGDIDRDGSESGFGFNDKSWALDCDQRHGCTFWSHQVERQVPGEVGSRVGVFVDTGAGVLAFYDVSETMSLLHRVHTTFTQPLFAGVCFNWNKAGDTVYFPSLR